MNDLCDVYVRTTTCYQLKSFPHKCTVHQQEARLTSRCFPCSRDGVTDKLSTDGEDEAGGFDGVDVIACVAVDPSWTWSVNDVDDGCAMVWGLARIIVTTGATLKQS